MSICNAIDAPVTTFAKTVLDDADAATARATLGAAASGANSDITSLSALSTPLSVAQGGTGIATITSHDIIIGNGTSAPTLLAPHSSSGVPLVSQGSSSNPSYNTCQVIGGGTGVTAILAHYIPVGAGTSSINEIAPNATSGIPLISKGASADPNYGTAIVAGGGTGNTTFTAYSLITAGTTSTGAFQNVVGVGSLNQVLISQGAGALPQWGSVPGISPAALTKVDDTNVTLTLGGTPATALLQAASLTLGWTGQLGLTRGGTNANLTPSNGGIVYSTASELAIMAGTSTAGQMLQSGASTTPSWSTTTYPATNSVNTLLYASSANVMSALATANSGVLVTSAGGVPSISSTLPAGLTIPGYASSGTNTDITSLNAAVIGNTTQNNAQFLMPVNAQTGTTYTLAANDCGKIITFSNASAITVTLPQQSTTTTSAGYNCRLRNIGSGTVTVVKEGSETLSGNSRMVTNAEMLIERETTTSWQTFGGTAIVNLFGTHEDIGAITTSQTINIVGYVGVGSTLLGVYQKCRALTTAGTFSINKNGTPLSGLESIVPSTAGSYTTATGTGSDNVLVRGDQITIVANGTLVGVLDLGLSLDLTQPY